MQVGVEMGVSAYLGEVLACNRVIRVVHPLPHRVRKKVQEAGKVLAVSGEIRSVRHNQRYVVLRALRRCKLGKERDRPGIHPGVRDLLHRVVQDGGVDMDNAGVGGVTPLLLHRRRDRATNLHDSVERVEVERVLNIVRVASLLVIIRPTLLKPHRPLLFQVRLKVLAEKVLVERKERYPLGAIVVVVVEMTHADLLRPRIRGGERRADVLADGTRQAGYRLGLNGCGGVGGRVFVERHPGSKPLRDSEIGKQTSDVPIDGIQDLLSFLHVCRSVPTRLLAQHLQHVDDPVHCGVVNRVEDPSQRAIPGDFLLRNTPPKPQEAEFDQPVDIRHHLGLGRVDCRVFVDGTGQLGQRAVVMLGQNRLHDVEHRVVRQPLKHFAPVDLCQEQQRGVVLRIAAQRRIELNGEMPTHDILLLQILLQQTEQVLVQANRGRFCLRIACDLKRADRHVYVRTVGMCMIGIRILSADIIRDMSRDDRAERPKGRCLHGRSGEVPHQPPLQPGTLGCQVGAIGVLIPILQVKQRLTGDQQTALEVGVPREVLELIACVGHLPVERGGEVGPERRLPVCKVKQTIHALGDRLRHAGTGHLQVVRIDGAEVVGIAANLEQRAASLSVARVADQRVQSIRDDGANLLQVLVNVQQALNDT